MDLAIINGVILSADGLIDGGSLILKNGKIARIAKSPKLRLRGARLHTIDAKKSYVAPGFIDLQIYGEPERIAREEAKYGTTGFLATIPCLGPRQTLQAIETIVDYMRRCDNGAKVLGINLEGPYLNRARAGAQKKNFIRRADANELRTIIRSSKGHLKLMTIAPEIEGALSLIGILRKRGIIASIGHTEASYEQAKKAADKGARCVTHVFNAMAPFHQRKPGVIGAALTDERVTATVIPDSGHIHPLAFKLLLRCNTKERVILITDSLKNDRSFRAGWDGKVYRLKDGTIAGTRLTMMDAVKNAAAFTGLSILDCVSFASRNPARLLGLWDRGEIKEGKRADIVIFDRNYKVQSTIIAGKVVYRRCAE